MLLCSLSVVSGWVLEVLEVLEVFQVLEVLEVFQVLEVREFRSTKNEILPDMTTLKNTLLNNQKIDVDFHLGPKIFSQTSIHVRHQINKFEIIIQDVKCNSFQEVGVLTRCGVVYPRIGVVSSQECQA